MGVKHYFIPSVRGSINPYPHIPTFTGGPAAKRSYSSPANQTSLKFSRAGKRPLSSADKSPLEDKLLRRSSLETASYTLGILRPLG